MDFDLESDKNDFTLSFIYGFPIDCIDLGFAAGFAYHNEENKTSQEWMRFGNTNPIFQILLYPFLRIIGRNALKQAIIHRTYLL